MIHSDHKSSEPSPRDRGVIALVTAIVISLLLITVVQVFSTDFLSTIRSLQFLRNPRTNPPVPDGSPSLPGRETLSPRGADAQLSAPRGRRRESSASNSPPVDDASGNFGAPVTTPEPAAAGVPQLPPASPDTSGDLTNTSEAASPRETATELVRLAWHDFEYPVRVVSETRARVTYNAHRTRLLKAISHPRPSTVSLDLARRDFTLAQQQFAEDPRLDYAFGLMLWKHGKTDEAIVTFRRAGRLEATPFLPAALAEAWAHFLTDDPQRGLNQLNHVARVLASRTTSDSYPTVGLREQTCLVMGRALGYLSGPGHHQDLAMPLELTIQNIESALPTGLREPLYQGRGQVGAHQVALATLRDATLQTLHQEHVTACETLRGQIQTLRTDLQAARQDLERQTTGHAADLRQARAESSSIAAELAAVPEQLERLREVAMELTRPTPNPRTMTAPVHYHAIPGADGVSRVVPSRRSLVFLGPETAADRADRLEQLQDVRSQRDELLRELTRLREKQQELLALRREVDQDHDRTVLGARQRRVSLQRDHRVLEQQLAAVERDFRRFTRLRDSVDTIAAYVPWDPEIEAEALARAWMGNSAPSP